MGDEAAFNTPIIVIVYNRQEKVEKVLSALRNIKPSKLLIIADGPRIEYPTDIEKCNAVRSLIEKIDWDCTIIKNYSDTNMGLDKRVVTGLNWAFGIVNEAIILEDDVIPHPGFFIFCKEMLEKYKNDNRIMAISGGNFQFGKQRTNYSYYFSMYGHMPGWATWRRAWQCFDIDMQLLPELIEGNWFYDLFQNTAASKYWTKLLSNIYPKQNSPWDYKWLFSKWINNGLSIVPNVNLVSNIGYDTDGTNTKADSPFANMEITEIGFPLKHPPYVIRDVIADDYVEKIMFSSTFSRKVAYKLKSLFNKI